MKVGDILQHNSTSPNDCILTNLDSVRNHNVRAEPTAVTNDDSS